MKFLICTSHAEGFDAARAELIGVGDLFVWGTTFSLKTKPVKTPSDVERVRAPKNFLHPAGTTLITGGTDTAANAPRKGMPSKSRDSAILTPLRSPPDKPYYLAYMTDTDGSVGSFYVGRKQIWGNHKVLKFMLDRDVSTLIASKSICLPLSELGTIPTLSRTMRIAWEHGAIPVFTERLPHDEAVGSEGDLIIGLPAETASPSIEVKDAWAQLLSTCAIEPRASLARLARALAAFPQTDREGAPARAYMLRFRVDDREVVHPALVLLPA